MSVSDKLLLFAVTRSMALDQYIHQYIHIS
jgi:hypothetical protein